MMGPVSRRNVLFATLFGLIAAFLVYLYLTNLTRARRAETEPAQATVVAAARRIEPRSLVTSDMLTTTFVPSTERPALYGIEEKQEIVDKVAVRAIEPGSPIRREDVSPKNPELFGIAFSLPKGMRAVTIQTDAVSGVAGLLSPGNRVDVLATFRGSGGSVTRTILQNVRLLAVGRRATPSAPQEAGKAPAPQDASSTTLAVTPQQAERLILAADQGRLRLALRSVEDSEPASTAGATSREVIGASLQNAFAAPPPPTASQRSASIKSFPEPSFWNQPGPQPGVLPPAAAPAGKEVVVYRGTTAERVRISQ
ncbi:MAG: Flp pilus assembly protein CpaB [Armatimonadetes bacterium]|nr:Flp pilus assembly protein CpaB [Armatimonadota bacterium]